MPKGITLRRPVAAKPASMTDVLSCEFGRLPGFRSERLSRAPWENIEIRPSLWQRARCRAMESALRKELFSPSTAYPEPSQRRPSLLRIEVVDELASWPLQQQNRMMCKIANQAHRLVPRGHDEAGMFLRVSGGEHSLYAGQKLLSILEEDDPVTHWQKVAARGLDHRSKRVPSSFSSVQKLKSFSLR